MKCLCLVTSMLEWGPEKRRKIMTYGGEVRGSYGFGSGKQEMNPSYVTLDFRRRPNIHKQTWQHPKSKQWHCINYAIMRRQDRKSCLDATVKHGAECNTDHHGYYTTGLEITAGQWTISGRFAHATVQLKWTKCLVVLLVMESASCSSSIASK